MAALRNARHELFCQNLVGGMSQTQAYVDAGYSSDGANANAARLIANDSNIKLRISELMDEVAAETVWTKADAMNKLAALHDKFAVANEPAAGNIARTAIMDYAKLAGWVVDKKQVTGPTLAEALESLHD